MIAVCCLNGTKAQTIASVAGYIPSQLPVSCLTVAPRTDKLEKVVGRKPLIEVNVIGECDISEHLMDSFEVKSW
jgi:hypothetical protein